MDKSLLGKTMMYAARKTGFRAKGFRVYLLRDKEDEIGRKVAEDYELSRILRWFPELKHCRVSSVQDYYGTLILRVREAP